MKPIPKLALVGDYSPDVVAHEAIPRALQLAATAEGVQLVWHWVPTADIQKPARKLAEFAAVWLVPASPYESMAGALGAVQWARETARPFLGTCGGFQHALIEFARNVAGIANADHAETNPNAATPVVTPLACSLVEQSGRVRFVDDSQIRRTYEVAEADEGYHCRYGLNVAFTTKLEQAGLRFTAFDTQDDVRAFELPSHPFFIGTLFQPERSALRGEAHPLIRAFMRALGQSR